VTPIEVIAFLIGHITGWGEGSSEQTIEDLLVAGIGSGLISFVLIAGLAWTVPMISGNELVSITGTITGPVEILIASTLSALAAFIGTYFGYFARNVQEEVQKIL
jgi:hypothetical protein